MDNNQTQKNGQMKNFGPAQKRRPWYKKWWILTFLAASLALIALLFILSFQMSHYLYQTRTTSVFDTNNPSNTTVADLITADDPGFGNPLAKVQIVQFVDFKCEFCYEASFIVREIMNEYGNQIHFVVRDFPVHDEAELAAEASECAQEQGATFFWLMYDKMFLNQDKLTAADLKAYALQSGLETGAFDQCFDSGEFSTEVAADLQAGLDAGVEGTPTFFINGYRIPGVISKADFTTIIDKYLAQ